MAREDFRRAFEAEVRFIRRQLEALFRFPGRSPDTASRRREVPSPGPRGKAPATPRREGSPPPGGSGGSPGSKRERSRRRPIPHAPDRPPSSRKGPGIQAPIRRLEIRADPVGRFSSLAISLLGHGLLALILFPMLVYERPLELPPQTTVVHWQPRQEEKETALLEQIEKPTVVEETVDKPETQPPVPPVSNEVEEELTGIAGGNLASEVSVIGERTGDRSGALTLHGGSEATEGAVNAALDWLARHQDVNGSWSPRGFNRHCQQDAPGGKCDGVGFPEYRIGVTALATLAFLGVGADHQRESPWRDTVEKAVDWLRLQQQPDGCIGPARGEGKRDLYNHGLATIAIVEAAHLSGDPQLVAPARLALSFIDESQQPGGGWDYTPARTLRNDLSVTGWQVMAIEAGKELGWLPRASTIEGVRRFVRRSVSRDGRATYSNRGSGAGRQGVSIGAVGLLCRLYLGWSPRSAETSRATSRILSALPSPAERSDWDSSFQSMYYWYSATLALFHVGGKAWEEWNQALHQTFLPLQEKEGEAAGSWAPDPNWIGAAGGRITSTAFGALTFEVYYRYTPLYRMLGLSVGRGASGKRGSSGEPGERAVAPGKSAGNRSTGDR